MRIFKFLLLCAGAFTGLSILADPSRGNFICHGGLSAAKNDYHKEPDNKYNQTDYGLCLIAANQDEEGLIHLRSAGEKGHVTAVFELARYYQTGGTLDDQVLDPNNIQQAIDLYLRVTQMIQNYPAYPFGGARWGEIHYAMEMDSYYMAPHLYYDRFLLGSFGIDNFYKNGNQESEEEGRETYQDYRGHTTDSLQKTIHYADICLLVPQKNHFDANEYNRYRSLCQILKTTAKALLDPERDADRNILNQGLNAERLRLINDPACYRGLENCGRYQEVLGKMIAIIRTGHQQVAEVWNNG